jgi:hypothetical protein
MWAAVTHRHQCRQEGFLGCEEEGRSEIAAEDRTQEDG